jgi:hypothetical protein
LFLIGVLSAFSAGIPRTASAQNFSYGVKGGLAISSVPLGGEVLDQVAGQVSRDSSSKLGADAGVYVRFPVADRLAFQPEVMYVMKGVNLTMIAGGSVSMRTHYIDVPLLMRYRLGSNLDRTAYVFGGPNFGMKIGANAALDSLGQKFDLTTDPAIKTQDFGFAFGLGAERRNWLVETRVTFGITDIGSANFPHSNSLRNRTISILSGFKLR